MLVTIHKVKGIIWYDSFTSKIEQAQKDGYDKAVESLSILNGTFLGREFIVDTEEEAYEKLEEYFSYVSEQISDPWIKEVWKEVKEVRWEVVEIEREEDESSGTYKPNTKEPNMGQAMKAGIDFLKDIKGE